jgi:hypothetical protein
MNVGSVAVQLQYGLYVVGRLSKLAFHFMFKVVRLFVVVSSVRLACNGLRLGEGGDLHHKCSYEARTSNLRKIVIRSTKPPLLPNRCYKLVFFLSSFSTFSSVVVLAQHFAIYFCCFSTVFPGCYVVALHF